MRMTQDDEEDIRRIQEACFASQSQFKISSLSAAAALGKAQAPVPDI